jgi:hypothetical protein
MLVRRGGQYRPPWAWYTVHSPASVYCPPKDASEQQLRRPLAVWGTATTNWPPKTPTGLALSRPLGPVGGIRAREAGVGTARPSQDSLAGPVLPHSKNSTDLGEGPSQDATGREVGSRDSNLPARTMGSDHCSFLPSFLPSLSHNHQRVRGVHWPRGLRINIALKLLIPHGGQGGRPRACGRRGVRARHARRI